MTVKVTLPDGRTDEYMRSGDAFVKHHDGSLDVVRGGAPVPHRYAAGTWSEVEGDEKTWNKRGFRR
ncbi:hypothetical protein JDV09_10770 [Mycobacterium sp. Y57]|uniref:hypothetical protein n=1 Tax=Mycolicibacterium xanthum TaxID=2796469 RepID=UPI001C855088|nr:hypothetical protein [Mycolicibacterium xanthum]MBX7432581.1 hypothetical protein [Mycolicibacterium xanthum]